MTAIFFSTRLNDSIYLADLFSALVVSDIPDAQMRIFDLEFKVVGKFGKEGGRFLNVAEKFFSHFCYWKLT